MRRKARRAYNANHSYLHVIPRVRLSDLKKGSSAVVSEVEEAHSADPIARRLRELGFVNGEPVRVVASPLGGDPLLVQIGFTRFALRRSEAARVVLLAGDAV
jgi:ferrous iron transport protein A